MNQKLIIDRLKQRFGRFWLLIGLLLVAFALFYSGYWFGDSALNERRLLIAEQQKRLDELYTQTDKQQQQVNFLRVEMEIERQGAEHVQRQLKQLHEENHQLEKQLSFYQKIMAPELQTSGLEIDEFTIESTPAANIFRYKLVLVQTKKLKRYAKGYVEVTFNGVEGNNTKKYKLEQLTNPSQVNIPFSFQYFQILRGELIMPEGFSAQMVFVDVILPSGKWQKFERLDRKFPFEPY